MDDRIDVYGIQDFREDHSLAIPYLAQYLRDGCLILALGSGISQGIGLPNWFTLVERCLRETKRLKGTIELPDTPPSRENVVLCRLMDKVEKEFGKVDMGRNLDYRSMVRSCLYDGVTSGEVTPDPGEYNNANMLHHDLLIALGALLMGSKRGSVKEVFNFNFDDVLDWYLGLHGFDTHIVTRLPELQSAADVTIYHLHGYLPLSLPANQSSDFLIFGQKSYEARQGSHWDIWLDFFRSAMRRGIMLFIGLSGDDQLLGPSLENVKTTISDERFTGFWMFGPGADPLVIDSISESNIVPLCFSDFNQYPDFLLSICREALKV